MKNAFVYLTIIFLAGCSANPSRIASTAKQESSRLGVTSRPLSEFSNFELRPMELSAGVSDQKEKVVMAKQLENKLSKKLLPLLEEWKADGSMSRTAGTLLIQPQLQSLRIISGGNRFLAGSWAGDSLIDLNLKLADGQTGAIIANPRISRTSSAMGGAWSMGKTDKQLMDYIVGISHQYLVDNYKKQE